MSKLRDAARQALEALKKSHPYSNSDRDLDKHSEAIHALRTALAEQPAGPDAEPAIPPGYKLVPVEPTQAMLDAAGMCIVPEGKKWLDDSNRETWTAMLAAAPEAPEAPEAPQLTIPPGYKLVPIQKLTANTSGVQIWTHERAHGIGEHE